MSFHISSITIHSLLVFIHTLLHSDIYPEYDHPKSTDGAPVWEVEDEEDVKVYAAPMSHSVPCVGYVVEEQSRPGRLRSELVQPIVVRNLKALKEKGFRVPMKAMAVIKTLPEGSSFTFPDGTVVKQEDAVEPPRDGRKIVICGDTCDARAIARKFEYGRGRLVTVVCACVLVWVCVRVCVCIHVHLCDCTGYVKCSK